YSSRHVDPVKLRMTVNNSTQESLCQAQWFNNKTVQIDELL
ncbi:12813_t:CDS:1, partial [Entrophospora sp. SA101]